MQGLLYMLCILFLMCFSECLNKKNFITLVACVSNDIKDLKETSQTLYFAERAKQIKNNPEINRIITEYKVGNIELYVSCIFT